jgi:hypothetical protein
LGDVLEEFEGVLSSLLNHGSPFCVKIVLLQTILYNEMRLLVKSNF